MIPLIGCFGFSGPLRQYFSLYQADDYIEQFSENELKCIISLFILHWIMYALSNMMSLNKK